MRPPAGSPPAAELPAEVGAVVDRQATKRVALQFIELDRVTWDHRKLAVSTSLRDSMEQLKGLIT